jgi:uncharacterized FAD-dependent dehydrogenase
MGIVIRNIALPPEADESEAFKIAADYCGVSIGGEITARVHKKSVDARRGKVRIVRSVLIEGIKDEQKFIEEKGLSNAGLYMRAKLDDYISRLPAEARREEERPVVVGFGPAGIFAGLVLARRGLSPLIIERGEEMKSRDESVKRFKTGRVLNTESNIQFGEGGAGAYSDGKLTTRINDPLCDAVLNELTAHGAPADIMSKAHPHIGTDLLKNVVVNIRKEIISLGGTVLFGTRLEGAVIKNGALAALKTTKGEIPCKTAILAIGHSARDTFSVLIESGVEIVPKSFAVGFRIEHLQSDVDYCAYRDYAGSPYLESAEYFHSYREGDRGCFTFCMCPGGEVCAAASEAGGVVTNGMSLHARAGRNANAAVAVSVDASGFLPGPLGGIALARAIEEKAFLLGGSDYTAPAQLVGDFLEDRLSKKCGRVIPTYPLGVRFTSISPLLPPGSADFIRKSLLVFAKRAEFFGDREAVITAPETRTSSPVRIPRGEDFRAAGIKGLIPCGEGAGYAGGIMSAAVDGIKAALKV